MLRKVCRLLVVAVSILAITYSTALSEKCGTSPEELKQLFYSRWIGVKAPEFGPKVLDRLKGPKVKLEDYKGKRLLLYSYDSGDFVRGPSEQERMEIYKLLFKVVDIRDEVGHDNFAIIICTFSFDLYIMPAADEIPEDQKEFRQLKDIPVVMVSSPKPYDVLSPPGGIVIDRNGIIQEIYPRPMTEDEIRKAATAPDWDKPIRPAPVEDKSPNKLQVNISLKAKQVWSKIIPRVIGITAADINSDGVYKLLALSTDQKMLVISPEGNVENEIKVPIKITGKTATIQWAELEKGKMVFTILEDECPDRVHLLNKEGKILLSYPLSEKYKINSVAFVKVADDQKIAMLVGLIDSKDRKELHLVSPQGNLLWKIDESISTKNIAVLDKGSDGPGFIFRLNYDGKINIFDVSGKFLRTLSNDIIYAGEIFAADMDNKGSSQIVAISPVSIFRFNYKRHNAHGFAGASDLDGKILWKYPLAVHNNFEFTSQPIIAADVNSDGIKEWVIHQYGELAIIDISGKIIAKVKPEIKNWSSYGILPRKGKNALFIFGSDEEMNAYELEPMK